MNEQKRNIFIIHAYDLNERIEEYKEMFPDSYTDFDAVKDVLRKHMDDPVGQVFGISVASDWQDKCFGFEVEKQTPKATHFIYLGIWKT